MIRGFQVVEDEYREYSDVDIILPTCATEDSAGNDFYSNDDYIIKPKEAVLIYTDVKAYMGKNEVLAMYARSSYGIAKLMLSNSVGIIDSDYYHNKKTGGNIIISYYNYGDKPFVINRGDRIAQGVFQLYLKPDNGLSNIKRDGGFGSSGK